MYKLNSGINRAHVVNPVQWYSIGSSKEEGSRDDCI